MRTPMEIHSSLVCPRMAMLWGSQAAMTRRICAVMQSILVFIRRVTARYRSKGSNGSKSHPKAGSSWPMACPYTHRHVRPNNGRLWERTTRGYEPCE